jgi:ABC-type sugar transport system substrate-binding protein
MSKLSFLISLTTADNDYQLEQAKAAEEAARRHGATVKIIYADNDSITQSQQLLEVIQSRSTGRPDAIVFEPVGGTGFPQVARAAAAAGIGWVILNRDVDYLAGLRKLHRIPLFAVTSDHEEIGRIQGRQITALLPKGGAVLYVEGPSESLAARQRSAGMAETKPGDVQVKSLRAQWTEASAYKAVSSWLRLSTAQQSRFDVIAAHDDSMALGARKAFHDLPEGPAREHWLDIPYLGIDGMPKSGQAWVRSGLLAATIIAPPNAGQAIDMLADAVQKGTMPAERTLTAPVSFPTLGSIGGAQAEKLRTFSAFGGGK